MSSETSPVHRHFHVNQGYYQCLKDLGWTHVVDGLGPCSYETLPTTAVYYVNTSSYSLMPGRKCLIRQNNIYNQDLLNLIKYLSTLSISSRF